MLLTLWKNLLLFEAGIFRVPRGVFFFFFKVWTNAESIIPVQIKIKNRCYLIHLLLGYRDITYKWKIPLLLPEQGLILPFIAWYSHNCFLCELLTNYYSPLLKEAFCKKRNLAESSEEEFSSDLPCHSMASIFTTFCSLNMVSPAVSGFLSSSAGARMRRGWPLTQWDPRDALSQKR